MKTSATAELDSLISKSNSRIVEPNIATTLTNNDELLGIQARTLPIVGSSTRDSLTCIDIPSSVLAGILDFSLSRQTPKLRLNNYQSQKPWHIRNDSWFEINGQRQILADRTGQDFIQPFNRPRRSHYVNDVNSSEFRILSRRDGLTLRVSFETDGREIKGICRRCKFNQDRRAADSEIKPTKGNSEPYVDVDFSISYIGNQLSLDVQSVKSVTKVDSNGILGWFNKIFTRKLKQIVERRVFNYSETYPAIDVHKTLEFP